MKIVDTIVGLIPAALRPVAIQFAIYVAVSGSAFLVDVSIYWMLLKPLKFAAAAAVGGYIAGVSTHYFLSSRVAFRRQLQARGAAAEAPVIAKFLAAGGTGLVVTTLTVGLLADGLGMSPLIAKLIATTLSFVCVFSALRLFVFDMNADHQKPA